MSPEEVIKKALSRLKTDLIDIENAKQWDPIERFEQKYENIIPFLVDVLKDALKVATHFRQNPALAEKHIKKELLLALAILGFTGKKN